MDDLISRDEAIEALYQWMRKPSNNEEWQELLRVIQGLPAAQSEPLTDTEQRIFLAAMSRERKVCERVDKEWEELGDYSEIIRLVKVCREIERKVKKALWTN